MTCHAHRCCRRSGPTSAPDLGWVDHLLLAFDGNLTEKFVTILRSAGASAERHDLGLRVDCRGANWKNGLGHLFDELPAAARGEFRVALIPVAAGTLVFHRALLASQPLDVFVRTLDRTPACASPAPSDRLLDGLFLGDVFKGESLE